MTFSISCQSQVHFPSCCHHLDHKFCGLSHRDMAGWADSSGSLPVLPPGDKRQLITLSTSHWLNFSEPAPLLSRARRKSRAWVSETGLKELSWEWACRGCVPSRWSKARSSDGEIRNKEAKRPRREMQPAQEAKQQAEKAFEIGRAEKRQGLKYSCAKG